MFNLFRFGENFVMLKRVVVVVFFVLLAMMSFACLNVMNKTSIKKVAQSAKNVQVETVLDAENVYEFDKLSEECRKDDMVFCAIEKAVKCTINPDLGVCDKESVPSFVLGKVEDNIRPSKIGFNIVKIKPSTDSQAISVYTKSQCDASWFGLCNGTVIYLLEPSNNGWKVMNIYAIEG